MAAGTYNEVLATPLTIAQTKVLTDFLQEQKIPYEGHIITVTSAFTP